MIVSIPISDRISDDSKSSMWKSVLVTGIAVWLDIEPKYYKKLSIDSKKTKILIIQINESFKIIAAVSFSFGSSWKADWNSKMMLVDLSRQSHDLYQ